MSRKCTVSADSSSASPIVNTSCTSDDDREPRAARTIVSGVLVVDQERRQDQQPEEEVHHVRQHGDDRQDLGREQHLLDQVAAGDQRRWPTSISDDENHVHGRMPQNMNSAYGSISGGCVPGRTT